jgi:hypothetical protein
VPLHRRLAPAIAAAVVAALLPACGSGGAGPCAAPRQDPLDPRTVIHLLPAAPDPSYLTNPPTSGAHRIGYYPRGLLHAALANSVQVALLEVGFVLIQYRPGLDPAPLQPLTAISPYIAIAPNPTLPADVVASAWVHHQQCASPPSAAEASVLRAFITAYLGHGPDTTVPLARTTPGGR